MLKRSAAAMVLAVIFLGAGQQVYSQGTAAQCAFVSEVAGKAMVLNAGKYFRLTGMNGIGCGETIKVLPGAKVVLARCSNNTKVEIAGPAEFTVGPQQLTFKSGKEQNPTAVSPDLCPFFMAQAFQMLAVTEVDAQGNDLPRNDERTGAIPAPCPPPAFSFNLYLTPVAGDVYFTWPEVTRIVGDVVPGADEILVAPGGELAINSCDEGKKYQVKGPAQIRFQPQNDKTKSPVVFVNGKAGKVEKIDQKKCEVSRASVSTANPANAQPVGLDGKAK